MKVVGLISGGKDSLYNLYLAKKNGHELVCLANLHPPPGESEIDSYMYQSVGAEGIKAMAAALQLPLYRKEIKGKPMNTTNEYRELQGDEVEDLFCLLSTIQNQNPEIEAVSCGAILSQYQKSRLDNVCQRLGLKTLCYLWGRDQAELLDDMIQDGIDAIIIKVASAGLTTKHLGMTLKEAKEPLHEANKKYGAHICGEGGEYETYVIDSPLHESRISVDLCEAVLHADNAVQPVAYLKLSKVTLISKNSTVSDNQPDDPSPSKTVSSQRPLQLPKLPTGQSSGGGGGCSAASSQG
ncbi:unnamed protein product [Bursaphelenchus okinawaensis]|uniref:Diphthine--ammonia ligase n=1 Tax=Bursaphelenchus okinawaensis TaxID=465554 RepID=A0A811JVL2_9BILA|nr:unnamed protein product [Bursaphelenchus okinawaensis]CAG9084420.1 unnamed protein product [Bursaphelenchus okinawaensis]